MNENGEPLPPPDDDRTPTQEDAPPPKKGEDWTMPEPVFRKSSGYLPKGVVERYQQAQQTPVDTETANIDNEQPAAGAEVLSQPETGDEEPLAITQDEAVVPAPKKKGRFLRILLITLGLLLAVGVVVAIVAAIVIWYFFQTSESQTFN